MIKSVPVWPLKKPGTPRPVARPDVVLNGPRITLRPAHIDDAPAWVTLRRNSASHLIPFEPEWGDDHLSVDFYHRRMNAQHRDWALGLSRCFLILTHQHDLMGGMNINNIVRGAAQFGTLGYWLGQNYQGQGYMSEATQLIIDYAFGDLGLERLNAATLPDNHRSMTMLKRAGFVEEGFAKSYLQINGKRQDHILFGLLKPEKK